MSDNTFSVLSGRRRPSKARFRGVGLLLAAVLVASPVVPVHAEPGLTVRREAWAEWELPDKIRGDDVDLWNYWVWVRRITTPTGEARTIARLTRYACERTSYGTYCSPRVYFEKVIPNDNFEFDDMLDSASVRFRAFGMKHRVAWEGEGATGRAETESACGESPTGDVGQGLNRFAESSGVVLGTRLRPGQSGGFTALSIEAYVKTC